MAHAIEDILRHPAVWRVGSMPASVRRGIVTGFHALDRELPDGGWPTGSLTELLTDNQGIGELELLIPALRSLGSRGVALIAPPHLPFVRAWESRGVRLDRLMIIEARGRELLWATEQASRSGACAMAIAWGTHAERELDYRALRRIHMAAEEGNCACFLYRSERVAISPSAAPLRVALSAHNGELSVRIVKRRGPLKQEAIRLDVFPACWYGETKSSATVRAEAIDAVRRLHVAS